MTSIQIVYGFYAGSQTLRPITAYNRCFQKTDRHARLDCLLS